MQILLFFELIKTVMTVIQCGFIFFESIKTVMEINSLTGPFFLNYRRRFVNRHHHTTANASTATNNTTKTTHSNTTKHNTHFQHRCMPTSFQVARGLHRKHQDSCFLHAANMFGQQGMDRSPRTQTFRQVRALCTKRADWRSDHCHCC